MKSLIIVTGTSKIILTRWLPLLRNVGQYKGDILVLDYGDINYFGTPVVLNRNSMELLKQQPNVSVLNPVRKLKNIFIDRLAVAQQYLNIHSEYEQVGFMDGNDTIFWGSIEPLLEESKDIICCVQEHPSNLLSIWGDFGPRKFCQDNFSSIMGQPIINGGVLFGPREEMTKLLKIIFDLVANYGDEPSDQVFLDIAVYMKMIPAKIVGSEWNYTHAVIGYNARGVPNGPRTPVFRDGKAFKVEDGTPVIIEHRTGTGHRLWGSQFAVQLLNGPYPISLMAEYEGTNWLFPNLGRGVAQEDKTPHLSNWLFP